MTLSMKGAWLARTGKNAALLSPCHTQNSPPGAAFYGMRDYLVNRRRCRAAVDGELLFLICSQSVLCSDHEPSILSCPQAPAGHGALRTGGGAFAFFPTFGRNPAR